MDEFNKNREILLQFIKMYEDASDKESFIQSMKAILSIDDEPLTLEDAYNEAYGSSLIQLYANNHEAGW